MFRSSNSLLAALLTLSLLFSRAHGLFNKKIVIGYAALTKDQADDVDDDDKIKAEGTPTGNYLGPGLYLVDSPDRLAPSQGSLFCVIRADEEKTIEAKKVYIPQSYQKKTLRGKTVQVNLWGNERAIEHYIKHEAKIDDSNDALRFSLVEDKEKVQMVVPNHVVDDGELKLQTSCFESAEQMKQFSSIDVNWSAWGILDPTTMP
ncbi:uncharacterized protein L3040_003628 [Drepanopeziza brunnea f. sp. 'multigermtubi']|uniref:Uncharacterized protein n=2 Tax=Drepanopeziza brunnea f. sp. 'multigermtubi' TaxID=698441 RepID=K1X035_MARBU|nr:uncharacterized protein MBM_07463 [Drepanopeziza brunnea f. sp. 'multigermtubi' MB_m1]ADB23426.1 Ecp10 [Drepanopeziza brunnea f. sp. 'multigermtubi']EKD14233.1 hypothetical protein MBM_07463 [Drepanopeziza brunnea f. sp. 'multigermtubi' MB_m1]KAJ5046384.1 hypothetical protein L3040_003628 [Drepanopeziza brunnea f. sp. 'multigermtubi']